MSEVAILARVVSRGKHHIRIEPVVKGELSIPLTIAHLCQNCNAVGGSFNRCPDCGSDALLNLARVLNR